MANSTKSALQAGLEGVAWLFFAVAAGAFWLGGRVIHEFAGTERVLAEMEGIILAVLFGGLGVSAKLLAHRFEEPSS